ncbi:MAG: calcium/sodium antiporter [Maricaulaceae bacterium]|nr:calcium/sodium antiporter [Maricaulaceae bacterium]
MGDLLLITAGLVLLAAGGEVLVRGAVGAAARLGVSPLLIGLVLVGFGTSAPELTTSVQAALAGSPGVAVGNVVGSNIANILLILGVSALVAPIAVAPAAIRRDGAALAFTQIAAAAALLLSPLGRTSGVLLIVMLLAYAGISYWLDRRGGPAAKLHGDSAGAAPKPERLAIALALFAAGLFGVIFGAGLLVDGAVGAAQALGVSETVIGLTVVAVGTSLPELAASLAAVRRGQGDLALGNIIGSNIFNATFILGAAALARPLPVPAMIASFDLWVMLGATALLLAFAWTGRRIDRREGAILLALYAGYIAWLAFKG